MFMYSILAQKGKTTSISNIKTAKKREWGKNENIIAFWLKMLIFNEVRQWLSSKWNWNIKRLWKLYQPFFHALTSSSATTTIAITKEKKFLNRQEWVKTKKRQQEQRMFDIFPIRLGNNLFVVSWVHFFEFSTAEAQELRYF